MAKQGKRVCRAAAGLLSAAAAALLGQAVILQGVLPDRLYLTEGESPQALLPPQVQARAPAGELAEAGAAAGSGYPLALYTRAGVRIKQVQVQVTEKRTVIPCGTPFGIKMFTDGVIIVGMSDIETGDGLCNPAKKAGLKIGDIVVELGGVKVTGNRQIAALIDGCGGAPVTIKYKRGNVVYTTRLEAVRSRSDGGYKAGIWVRDSSAGIGTMTYYDSARGTFAGLGHGVCDVDTSELMPIASGEVVRAVISGVRQGEAGLPGELQGSFVGEATGTILLNTPQGLFGSMSRCPVDAQPVELARSCEIQTGPAQILTTVSGEAPQRYEIRIEKVNRGDGNPNKNMVIRVTDPVLLEKTGGIVQGMSGSPILQNGRLIGAVTHVFVNDPTKGYGIFIENMENTMQAVEPALPKVS